MLDAVLAGNAVAHSNYFVLDVYSNVA